MQNNFLKKDIEWLYTVLSYRVNVLIGEKLEYELPAAPQLTEDYNDAYALLIKQCGLSSDERLILCLALIPYFAPEYLDILYKKNPETAGVYTEFGGVFDRSSNAFIPTCYTAIFLLSGNDFTVRLEKQKLIHHEQKLIRLNLLKIEEPVIAGPPMNGRLVPTDECLHWVLYQSQFKPNYSNNFPAKLLETRLTWDDLVLDYDTHEALDELYAWLAHHRDMESISEVSRKFKRGYRALFHGPPGTGKTLTATLMGGQYNLDVYHIDLSMLVSKYVGETEKNLKHIFDTAENKDWILFFDEADALFGKRTQTNSSNDRYANQEVSYLLQRVEDYPGLIILASNLKANMDKAFLRRFQSVVYFPIPGIEERYVLWKKAFSEHLKLDDEINLRNLAKTYELSGASIGNVLRYCTLMTLKRGDNIVTEDDILSGIKREFNKEGKMS